MKHQIFVGQSSAALVLVGGPAIVGGVGLGEGYCWWRGRERDGSDGMEAVERQDERSIGRGEDNIWGGRRQVEGKRVTVAALARSHADVWSDDLLLVRPASCCFPAETPVPGPACFLLVHLFPARPAH